MIPFKKCNSDIVIKKNTIQKIKEENNFIQRYFIKNEGTPYEYKIREHRQILLLSNNKNAYLPYSDIKLKVNGEIKGQIKELQKIIEEKFNKVFDLILVNFYSNPQDKMGWHRDGGVIDDDVIILSLGGSRIFQFREKETGKITSFDFNHGDIIHMWGKCQDLYDHRVKCHKKYKNKINVFEERMSIVFRQINKKTLDLPKKNNI